MRLVDLLMVLLFEGRSALPKVGVSSVSGRLPGLRRMDSLGERSHRQLIDCIRSKDTDALIDAVDNGKFGASIVESIEYINPYSYRKLVLDLEFHESSQSLFRFSKHL